MLFIKAGSGTSSLYLISFWKKCWCRKWSLELLSRWHKFKISGIKIAFKILLENFIIFFPEISLKSKLELETSMTPASFSISDFYQTWIGDILPHFQERKNSWDQNIKIKIEIFQTRESLVETIRVDFLWKWTRILHHLFKEKLIDFKFYKIVYSIIWLYFIIYNIVILYNKIYLK